MSKKRPQSECLDYLKTMYEDGEIQALRKIGEIDY